LEKVFTKQKELHVRWSWFLLGVCLLLAGSYLDNTRGTLIPALSEQMGFDYKTFGQILVAGHFAAFAMTWVLIPILNKVSIRVVTWSTAALATLLGTTVLLVDSPPRLILWGALLGAIVSLCGTLNNLYVHRSTVPELRGRAMAAAQSCYGLASFGAPLLVAWVLEQPSVSWRWLYISTVPFFIGVGIWCALVVPSRAKLPLEARDEKQSGKQWLILLVMLFYVAGEVLTSMWMTTWFVSQGKTLQEGASHTAAFFIVMTATRLLCSLYLKPGWQLTILWSALAIPLTCFLLGVGLHIHWLVPGMGFLGPFFPIYFAQIGIRFPDNARTMVIWVLALVQAMLALMHLTVGEIASQLGMQLAYWLAPVFIIICASLFATVQKHFR